MDEWSKKTRSVSVFQSDAGRLLGDLLGHWASGDEARRFPLLDQLLASMAGGDERTELENFIKQNVDQIGLAKGMIFVLGVIYPLIP